MDRLKIPLDQLWQAPASVRYKSIIDIAISFSAMNRVFEPGSKYKIAQELERSLPHLDSITSKGDFEKMHADFCEWFIRNVFTAKKVMKNGKIKESQQASYGQAAKLLNVVLKVYVYYCSLPNPAAAAQLSPLLHCAVDTRMMRYLRKRYPQENIRVNSVEAVSKAEYFVLQKMVDRHIREAPENTITPVQYDDILWFWLTEAPSAAAAAMPGGIDRRAMLYLTVLCW